MKIIQSMKNMQPQQHGITAGTLYRCQKRLQALSWGGANERVNAWEAPTAPRQGQWEPCLLSSRRIQLCFSMMFNTIG